MCAHSRPKDTILVTITSFQFTLIKIRNALIINESAEMLLPGLWCEQTGVMILYNSLIGPWPLNVTILH